MESPEYFYFPSSPFGLFHVPFQTSGCILKRKRFYIAWHIRGRLQQKNGLLLKFSKSSQNPHASRFFPGCPGGR
jgi:hypothetical protein